MINPNRSFPMREERMTLLQAAQHVGDQDLLRQLAEVALAKLMDFEVEGRIGAAKGEHAPERHTVS